MSEPPHGLVASVMNRVYEQESNKLYGYTLLINDVYCIINKDSLLEKVRSLQLHLSNAKVCRDGKLTSLYSTYIPTLYMERKHISNFGSTTVVQIFCTSGKITCALVYEKARMTQSNDIDIDKLQVNGLQFGYNVAVGKIFTDNLANHVYSNFRLVNDRILPAQRYVQFSKFRPKLLNILNSNHLRTEKLCKGTVIKEINTRTTKISFKHITDNEVLNNIILALIYDRLNTNISFIVDKIKENEIVITSSFGSDNLQKAIATAFLYDEDLH